MVDTGKEEHETELRARTDTKIFLIYRLSFMAACGGRWLSYLLLGAFGLRFSMKGGIDTWPENLQSWCFAPQGSVRETPRQPLVSPLCICAGESRG